MTTPDDALLPCAHCGGEAKHYHRPDTTGWSNTDWVSCSDDDCGVSTAMEETKAGAIAAWNRRAILDHITALTAERDAAAAEVAQILAWLRKEAIMSTDTVRRRMNEALDQIEAGAHKRWPLQHKV
jgi:Lar family restriction alleviation protein